MKTVKGLKGHRYEEWLRSLGLKQTEGRPHGGLQLLRRAEEGQR